MTFDYSIHSSFIIHWTAPHEVEDALGVVLAEIDEIAKATFRSITLATMLKLVERRRALAG